MNIPTRRPATLDVLGLLAASNGLAREIRHLIKADYPYLWARLHPLVDYAEKMSASIAAETPFPVPPARDWESGHWVEIPE